IIPPCGKLAEHREGSEKEAAGWESALVLTTLALQKTSPDFDLSRRSRNQTGRHAADAEPPRPYGRFWMIRRYTSARFVPADAGAKDKNPMGSMLFSASIIASSVPDCHQILRTSCQESVRK